jgi:hypothetical protein
MSDRLPIRSTPVFPPDPRLNAELVDAERRAIAAIARLNAGALVARFAMHHAAELSEEAGAAYRRGPVGEEGYEEIIAAFRTVAVAELENLGIRRPRR